MDMAEDNIPGSLASVAWKSLAVSTENHPDAGLPRQPSPV